MDKDKCDHKDNPHAIDMTWTELHDACERRDAAQVQRLALANSEDLVQIDEHQATPLHVFFCYSPSDPTALKALLEACPQAANHQDIHGDTPLHVCCRSPSANKQIVQMLLDAAPKSASMCNREGLMPLHVACRQAPANEEVIGLLIHINPNALRHRIKMGNLATKRQSSPLDQKKNDHPFIDAANNAMRSKGSVGLRFRAADLQVRDGAFPIHIAIGAGAPRRIVEMLIKAAGDDMLMQTNKFGETPLMIALHRKDPEEELVRVSISACPDAVRLFDKKGNLPIHAAVTFGANVQIIKDLLEQWPEMISETNGEGVAALDLAVHSLRCSEQLLGLLTLTDSTV
jgi:ankyrin repeat protein